VSYSIDKGLKTYWKL